MRNGLRTLIAGLILLGTPGTAHAQLGDPVELPIKADYLATVSAVAGAGYGPAFAIDSKVAYQAPDGKWHRFTLPGTPASVRLAPGLVAWDQGAGVYVRTWGPDGTLGAARLILTGVKTTWDDGGGAIPGWDLSADNAGTVAIAAPGAAGGVYATVRDPGHDFPAPQLVAPGEPPWIGLSPIAQDGTVTLGWATNNTEFTAVRAGRAATFGAPQPGPAYSDAFADPDTATIRLTAEIRRLCATPDIGCTGFKLFHWSDGTELLAFTVDRDGNPWYTATRQADGRFGKPVRRYRDGAVAALWTQTPGRLAFAIAAPDDTLNLVTEGVKPKLRPRTYFGYAVSSGSTLMLSATCRSGCRLSARIGDKRFAAVRLDPLQPAYFDIPEPAGTRVRVTLTARDSRGRTHTVARTLRRGREHEGMRPWS